MVGFVGLPLYKIIASEIKFGKLINLLFLSGISTSVIFTSTISSEIGFIFEDF